MSSSIQFLIISVPLICCILLAFWNFVKEKEDRDDLKEVFDNTTISVKDKTIIKVEEKKHLSSGFLKDKEKEMLILEFPYKMDEVLAVAFVAGIVAAFASALLFKAGPLLMLFLGGVAVWVVFDLVDDWLEKKRYDLTVEYLEKMRDVSTFLSAGKSLQDALAEACESNISPVLKRELETVRKDIFTGAKFSSAFMKMYERLQIEDIQKYAQTLRTFEQTGGNLIRIMAINDRYSKQKLEIQNAQKVYQSSQSSSQRIIVGLPLAMIIVEAIFNPSFFGTYYSTIVGQFIAIVAVSILVVGLKRSKDLTK